MVHPSSGISALEDLGRPGSFLKKQTRKQNPWNLASNSCLLNTPQVPGPKRSYTLSHVSSFLFLNIFLFYDFYFFHYSWFTVRKIFITLHVYLIKLMFLPSTGAKQIPLFSFHFSSPRNPLCAPWSQSLPPPSCVVTWEADPCGQRHGISCLLAASSVDGKHV